MLALPYSLESIIEESKKVIDENGLFFIEDVCAYLGISKTTFYEYIKVDSDEMNEIRVKLRLNRASKKVALRKKWEKNR